jgi:hypothetical protein
MNVAVYAESSGSIPYLRVLSAGLDTVEEAAAKYLTPYGVEFVIVDDATIPQSPYIGDAQTVTIVDGVPFFSWDLPTAKSLASSYNAKYWQNQYNAGLLGLSLRADYQLQLAIATPENERTADQVAAVEFLTGINGLQTTVDNNIAAATTGEELVQILSQLG